MSNYKLVYMKSGKTLVLMAIGSMLITSCYRRDHDYGNNYYNNPYNRDTSYVYNEQFNGSDNNLWNYTDATDSVYATVTDTGYQYVDYSTTKSAMNTVQTGVNVANNFTVTTRIKSNHMMGLIFGASSTSNGYAFYLDTAGNYSIYQEGTGSTPSIVIVPSTQDTLYAVKNNWNTLEVDQVNGVWNFYINGTQVTTMSARALSGGAFGYKVLPGTVGYASYLKVTGSY